VGTKAERRTARALVTAYHEARLAELIEHVAEALERYRQGELDAFEVDDVIHRYKRAARELWKFCWSGGSGSGVELVARTLEQLADEGERIDWWERAVPAER
jgi:DNA-binding NtrC family response regulator